MAESETKGLSIETQQLPMLDYFITLGVAVRQLTQAICSRPDVEVRIKDGIIYVGANNAIGGKYLELCPLDFEIAARFVVQEPRHS